MKRGRKKRVAALPHYKVLVYRNHPSGIGNILVREEYVAVRPTFETHWFDDTNRCWARTI